MRKTLVLSALVLAAVLPLGESAGFASVGSGLILNCGTSGTLYTNLTGSAMNFDLGFLQRYDCAATLSWTDADGQAQNVTINADSSQYFTTSLPAGGVISWSTPNTGGRASLIWRLGTSAVNPGFGIHAPCGASGAVYTNLSPNPIKFNLGVGGVGLPACGSVTWSWTDADGQAQTITVSAMAEPSTQGASTSLPPGGVLSWTTAPGAGTVDFGVDIERAPIV